MSGGNFNYLCWKDYGHFISGAGLHDLLAMTDLIEHEFPDTQAAIDTRAFYEKVRALYNEFTNDPNDLIALRDVWHAIEWWQSCDINRDAAAEAIAKYTPPTQMAAAATTAATTATATATKSQVRKVLEHASRKNLLDRHMRWPQTHSEMAEWIMNMGLNITVKEKKQNG